MIMIRSVVCDRTNAYIQLLSRAKLSGHPATAPPRSPVLCQFCDEEGFLSPACASSGSSRDRVWSSCAIYICEGRTFDSTIITSEL